VKKKNLIIKNSFHKSDFNKKFIRDFENIKKEIFKSTNDTKKIWNIFSDHFKLNFKTKDLVKFKKFKNIVVIGMGGSILGTESIYFFLKKKIKKKFYFLSDLDADKINDLKKKVNSRKTLFLIISKSGNTIETLTNLLALNILKKKQKNIILISEKKNNILFSFSKKLDLFYIEHKNYIGGRYSVLSEVGLVPAYLMGLNILKIRKNSNFFLFKNEIKLLKSSVLDLANILIKNKLNNLILLNYAPQLEKFLYWYQQLVAESLGKKGKGFLPVVSNAPKDHHSLLQLYLDGQRDKLFYIFSVEKKSNLKIKTKKFSNRINYLHGKDLNDIKDAQKNALIKALKKKKIPFREFKINRINEEVLGELFSYFMLETIFIGKITKINPFDQPAVEQVKIFTKNLLS
jgi:glucose-6-phosphate isomerase